MIIQRYAKIFKSPIQREIVLLKGFPCVWGKCSFCDYIQDNDGNEEVMNQVNESVLKSVEGCFGVLQAINSGSCFELPNKTLSMLREVVIKKDIKKLMVEAYWSYRHRLDELREFFKIPIIFMTGIETFDDEFRNKVLCKGVSYGSVAEVSKYFDSVCLMVGIKGQTRQMIRKDIDLLLKHFSHGTINLFSENRTLIKPDHELQEWFKHEFAWLENEPGVDILWHNTDFGVGRPLSR